MRKRLLVLFSILIVGAMLLSACGGGTVVETVIVEREGEMVVETVIVEKEGEMAEQPVTLDWVFTAEPPTLDPALVTDNVSVEISGSLFGGLTNLDPVTNEVLPWLATEWVAGENADGEPTYTFTLRDDVAWVHYDPITGETTQVVDADGNPRFVNAHDVVFGAKRTIDPETGSDYAYVTYVIKNALPVNSGDEGYTLDDVGVVALDDYTVEYTLEYAAGYFPSIAAMWILYPQPAWSIEEWAGKWTEAGLINTYGPYVLDTWIHGGELIMVKNPLWVMADDVQIERIYGYIIQEESTAFALYENNEVDTVSVPLPEIDRVKADPVLSEDFYNAPAACTYYYGFTNDKPPFDDHRVRKAFSQAIDRQSLIDNVTKGGQIPATSFAPPGIFGAPAPGTVGLGFDADAAKAYLQEYLDEKGMTLEDFNAMDIVLMHNTSEGHARIAAAIQQMWADTLGVEVRIENQEWKVYLKTIEKDTPLDQMPHVWRMGWCADYADENNWIHEVFNADEGANDLRRESGEMDEITVQAARETDADKRYELYAEAERLLAEVETAYAPIYHYTTVNVTKPWLTRNFPNIIGNDFYNWVIDWDAKLAATQ
jgi:oligopeptide transport system substrate-binding protein